MAYTVILLGRTKNQIGKSENETSKAGVSKIYIDDKKKKDRTMREGMHWIADGSRKPGTTKVNSPEWWGRASRSEQSRQVDRWEESMALLVVLPSFKHLESFCWGG